MVTQISVVIPTIGRPSVDRALASVLGQTLAPHAVIVVDNGPLEGAEDRRRRIEAWSDPDNGVVTWVQLPPRSGSGHSRNMGALLASTPYVAFLDDDDEFEAGYLEAMSRAIDEHGAVLHYGLKRFVDEAGTQVRVKSIDNIPASMWLDRLCSNKNHGFGGQNVVVERATFFDMGGFDGELRLGEDRALAIAALRAGHPIVNVPDAVVRCHSVSGFRMTTDAGRWFSWLKITVDNWSVMRWGVRRVAVRKVLRAYASFAFKRLWAQGRIPRFVVRRVTGSRERLGPAQ